MAIGKKYKFSLATERISVETKRRAAHVTSLCFNQQELCDCLSEQFQLIIIFHFNSSLVGQGESREECVKEKHIFVSDDIIRKDFFVFSDVILVLFLELLEFSEDRSPWESVEEKLNDIRYEQFLQFLPFLTISFFINPAMTH